MSCLLVRPTQPKWTCVIFRTTYRTKSSNIRFQPRFLKAKSYCNKMHNFVIRLWSLLGCLGVFGTFWDLWRYLSIVAAVWQIENPIFECVTSHVLGLGGELHRSLRNCPPLINTPGSVVSDNVEDPGNVGGKNPGKMLLSWDIGGSCGRSPGRTRNVDGQGGVE